MLPADYSEQVPDRRDEYCEPFSFDFLSSFGVEFRVAVAIAVTAAAARLKKLDLCPRSMPTRLNSLAFARHRKYGCARSNHRENKAARVGGTVWRRNVGRRRSGHQGRGFARGGDCG